MPINRADVFLKYWMLIVHAKHKFPYNFLTFMSVYSLYPLKNHGFIYPKATAVILTHWGRVTHLCVGDLTIIGSDNGLSPGRRQAIIWNNAGSLLIGPLGTNFHEIQIEILPFSFKKMRLKMLSAKRRPFYLGLNALMYTLSYVNVAFDINLQKPQLWH